MSVSCTGKMPGYIDTAFYSIMDLPADSASQRKIDISPTYSREGDESQTNKYISLFTPDETFENNFQNKGF